MPVTIPAGVTVDVTDANYITVKGPLAFEPGGDSPVRYAAVEFHGDSITVGTEQ